MSQENVEIVRTAFDALNRKGVAGLLPFLDPQIEWISIPGFLPDARDYYGHEAVVLWFDKMAEVAEGVRWELEEVIDAGNPLVLASTMSGRGLGSGVPIQITVFHVIRMAGGKATRFESYVERGQALAAADRTG
jgi:ketosteroid isomerase-like protein